MISFRLSRKHSRARSDHVTIIIMIYSITELMNYWNPLIIFASDTTEENFKRLEVGHNILNGFK